MFLFVFFGFKLILICSEGGNVSGMPSILLPLPTLRRSCLLTVFNLFLFFIPLFGFLFCCWFFFWFFFLILGKGRGNGGATIRAE